MPIGAGDFFSTIRGPMCFIACAVLLSCGCGHSIPPAISEGEVDASLPTEDRALQQAVVDVLRALQYGTPYEQLARTVPRVDWREDRAAFFGQAAALDRWKWTGPVQNNRVYVELTLLNGENDPGATKVARIYEVKREGNRFVIQPVSN